MKKTLLKVSPTHSYCHHWPSQEPFLEDLMILAAASAVLYKRVRRQLAGFDQKPRFDGMRPLAGGFVKVLLPSF
jgi:hypothetical protein